MKVLLLLMLPFVNGFLSGSPKLIKTSRDAAVNINPMQYANTISRKSFSELIKDVDNKNVDALFFTNDMKTVYSREDLNTDGIYDIEDYSITTVDPSVSTMIFEHSSKQNIKTTILEAPIDPVNTFINGFYGLFNALFIPTVIILFVRSLFSRGPMNSMGPMGGNLGPFGGNVGKDDKLNMIKANVSLASWAGSPEIFQECTEIVTYLNNRTLYEIAGANIPRGILLEGPPGTGKTLIAKAIASECDANFISIAASEFVELFVGMGAAKVRNLFKQARENSACIVFIDEIDAVGKQRGTGINAGNDEREQTLNQILAEMDGFAQNDNVLVIAATNRRDVLDNALLRPGRFDRIVNVPLPDTPSRLSILNVHSQNKNISQDVDLSTFAELTAGFSGAEIKNLMNEAAIFAVRKNSTTIGEQNIRDALEKLTVGIIKQNDTRSSDAVMRESRHEIGHAFLAAYFDEYFDLQKVSIQSTYNGAGGYTLFRTYPEITESGLYTKDILLKQIIIALGGKAAEYVFYGDKFVSLGAQQDLKQANSLAKQMVGNYGMGEALKTFYNENTENSRAPFLGRSLATNDGVYSEAIKEQFDKEVRGIVDKCYKEAVEIIHNNQHKVNILSNILINAVTINGEFVKEYSKIQNVNSSNFEE